MIEGAQKFNGKGISTQLAKSFRVCDDKEGGEERQKDSNFDLRGAPLMAWIQNVWHSNGVQNSVAAYREGPSRQVQNDL